MTYQRVQGNMLLYFRNIMRHRSTLYLILIGLILLMGLPGSLHAQEEDLFGSTEDDSLLFGDEFDLGDDEFSFEIDEGDDTEAGAAEEDDFFGDFGEEEETEGETAVADTSELDEWGLESEDDYESLITRAAEGEVPEHPLDLRPKVKDTIFEDTGFTLSFYSPHVVPEQMDTWFSFMDISLTTELPWHFTFDPVELSFLVDVSSFKFVNSFPVGGEFKGFSIMPIARVEMYGFETEVGLGMFIPTFGAIAGLGYSYQFHSLFFSAGYRWNWAYNIDPIGSGWWLEPRLTMGLKFW